jgi:hypothetical protein
VDRVLGLADAFLDRAGGAVSQAFGDQLVVVGDLADGFLNGANAFLDGAFDGFFAHGNTP